MTAEPIPALRIELLLAHTERLKRLDALTEIEAQIAQIERRLRWAGWHATEATLTRALELRRGRVESGTR